MTIKVHPMSSSHRIDQLPSDRSDVPHGIWWALNRKITLLIHLDRVKKITITAAPQKSEPNVLYTSNNLNIISSSLIVHTFPWDAELPTYLLMTMDGCTESIVLTQIPYSQDNDRMVLPLYRAVQRATAGAGGTTDSKHELVVAANTANQVVSKVVQETIKQIEGLIYSL